MRQQAQSFMTFIIISIIIIIFYYFFFQIISNFSTEEQFIAFLLTFLTSIFSFRYFSKKDYSKNLLQVTWQRMLSPFKVEIDTNIIQYSVEVARIFTGLFVMFSFIDSLSYGLLLSQNSELILRGYMMYIILSLLFTIGFYTPLVTFIFLIFIFVAPTYFPFEILLLRIVLIGSLFLGGGRLFSLDYFLKQTPIFQKSLSYIYSYIPPTSQIYYAKIRLLLLALFWGINLTAGRGHLEDTYWRSGDVISILLTMPYFVDFHQFFDLLKDANPQLFYYATLLGMFVQSIYEVFLLPLCFFKLGRMFVAFQLTGFSIVILIFINVAAQVANIQFAILVLTFLPEIFALLKIGKPINTDTNSEIPTSHTNSSKKAFGNLYIIFSYIIVLQLASQIIMIWSTVPNNFIAQNPYTRMTLSSVSQLPDIDVYNTLDIVQSTLYMVIAEANDNNELLRTLPTLDINGARLNYMRSDYMIYDVFVPWQRQSDINKIDLENNLVPTRTRNFIQQQIVLDACLENNTQQTRYLIFVFTNPIEQREYFRSYSDQINLNAVIEYTFAENDMQQIESMQSTFGFNCYNLPPNHFNNEARAEETLDHLQLYFELFLQENNEIILLD